MRTYTEGLFAEFQFHLVRLKANKSKTNSPSLLLFQFHLVRLKAAGCEGGRREAEFQFHLVRLKVPYRIYGGIELPGFQFHLVRLKVFLPV